MHREYNIVVAKVYLKQVFYRLKRRSGHAKHLNECVKRLNQLATNGWGAKPEAEH